MVSHLVSGSGFFIGAGLIATNLHVVKHGFKGYVKRVGMNAKYTIVKIVAVDSRQDLAILRVSDIEAPSLSFGDSDIVKTGDPIYAVGKSSRILGRHVHGGQCKWDTRVSDWQQTYPN